MQKTSLDVVRAPTKSHRGLYGKRGGNARWLRKERGVGSNTRGGKTAQFPFKDALEDKNTPTVAGDRQTKKGKEEGWTPPIAAFVPGRG